MNENTKSNFILLTCHKYDFKNNNIEGLFNTIELGEDNVLTFDLLTIMNFINKSYKDLTVFYCIYNAAKNPDSAKIINKSKFYHKPGLGTNGRKRATSLSKLSSAVKALRISNMKFTEKGDYEIRAYCFWDEECKEITEKEASEVSIDELLSKTDNLGSVLNIEVV